MTFVPFAEYRPDDDFIKSIYTDDIKNVFVGDGSYIPVPSFGVTSKVNVPDLPYGSIGLRTLNNQILLFVGTATKLFILRSSQGQYEDVSQEGVSYNAGPDNRWSFAVFGPYIIAVNKNDKPQVFNYENDTRFRDLGLHNNGEGEWVVPEWTGRPEDKPSGWDAGIEGVNMPPRGGVVKSWGNFVAIMNQTDHPNRVSWSAVNDQDYWVPGSRSSDYQDFMDGGIVYGSNEATNPILFLQTAIYFATFVPGSDIVFSFQKAHDKRGLKSPESLASRGALSFFADEGGFYQISSDGQLDPIGFEKVNGSVFSVVNSSNLAHIEGVIDPFYSRVYWCFDYNGVGHYNRMLVYDWVLQKWTNIEIALSNIVPVYAFGTTLDELDNVSESLDLLPYSLDSKVWQSGAPIMMGISIGNRPEDLFVGSFNGPNMEAVILTQEFGQTDRQMSRITGIMPVVDNDNVTISVGVRNVNSRSTNITWLKDRPMSYNTGYVNVRARARYMRFKVTIPYGETWKHAVGVDVDFQPAGYR